MKFSILIPARGETKENLGRTLKSIYDNATGEFEVIVGLNGQPWTEIEPYPNLRVIRLDDNIGIKGMINLLALLAKGKYIYKSDAHCSFSKGFDEVLQQDMQDDWIVTPRFYVLDGRTWGWQDDRFYDYFYLSCPFTDPKGFRFKAGGHWGERTKERLEGMYALALAIDETPQIHGSGWMMTKDRYFELGGFPLQDPYGHAQEPLWLALRNQLEGGKCMVNKNAWYAHLHQDSKSRGYSEDKNETEKTYNIVATTFMKDPRMMEWLEKNMPMPSWNSDWKEVYTQWLQKNIS